MDKKPIITDEKDLKIIYKGEETAFKHFIPKSTNLMKVNLIDKDGDSEGIWACVSDESKKIYENSRSHGERFVALLRNDSLAAPPWGTYIMAETRGENRPFCKIEDMAGDLVFNQVDTVEE